MVLIEEDAIGSGEFRLPYDLFDLLLAFLAANGVPPTKLIQNADITAEQLLARPSYVRNDTYNMAITLLLETTGDPYAAMKFGLAMSNRAHGMFGLAIQSSQDLAEAYEILPTFFLTRTGHAQTLTMTKKKKHVEITVHSGRAGAPNDYGRFNSLATLVNLLWMSRKITGTELTDIADEIDVTWQQPLQEMPPDLLPEGTRINYSRPKNLLRHDESHLRTQVISSNPALREAAIRECEIQLASPPKTSITDQVRWVFRILHPVFPTLSQVAEYLHMSAPTLKRKLNLSGTSYNELKDKIRFGRVIKLLKSTDLTLDDIAHEVDFNNSSNLTKAFKHHFKCTPGEYRRSHKDDLVQPSD